MFEPGVNSNTPGNPCDEKIVSRIKELLKGKTTVRRLKLLFIGPGGVGKTSVIRRLNGREFKAGLPLTDGVEVVRMILEEERIGKSRILSEVQEMD